MSKYIPKIGDRVEILDNGWLTTHITPRWSYHYKGKVIRLNDLSVTIILDDFDGMKIRANYEDVYPESLAKRKEFEEE